MILRARRLQRIVHVRGQDDEDLVGIDRIEELRALERA